MNISGISAANEDGSEFSIVGADLNVYFYSSDYLLISCISIENETDKSLVLMVLI